MLAFMLFSRSVSISNASASARAACAQAQQRFGQREVFRIGDLKFCAAAHQQGLEPCASIALASSVMPA